METESCQQVIRTSAAGTGSVGSLMAREPEGRRLGRPPAAREQPTQRHPAQANTSNSDDRRGIARSGRLRAGRPAVRTSHFAMPSASGAPVRSVRRRLCLRWRVSVGLPQGDDCGDGRPDVFVRQYSLPRGHHLARPLAAVGDGCVNCTPAQIGPVAQWWRLQSPPFGPMAIPATGGVEKVHSTLDHCGTAQIDAARLVGRREFVGSVCGCCKDDAGDEQGDQLTTLTDRRDLHDGV